MLRMIKCLHWCASQVIIAAPALRMQVKFYKFDVLYKKIWIIT